MSLSVTLLAVAVACALLPLGALGFRPPSTIRDVEKALVVGMATLVVAGLITSRLHTLRSFGIIHLAYLLLVVTLPLLLGAWWVLSILLRRRTLPLNVAGLIAVTLALGGVWATHIEPNWLRVDRVEAIGEVQAPLRIGVLADLQTPNVGKHEWKAIDALLDERLDMVLVPGDLFQGEWQTIAAGSDDFTSLLRTLVEEIAVVGVVSGDSDNPALLAPMVEAAGAIFLDNTITTVTIGGQQVRLAGVTVLSSAKKLDTLAGLGESTSAFTVLVSHRPDVVYDLPLETDVDLIVSGHTHGGQIALPFLGPPLTLSDVPRDLAAGGIGTVENFVVYVSTGVGLERRDAPQVRFGVRPSVGIIDVRPPS